MTPHSIQVCSFVCCNSSRCSLVRATGPNPRLSLDSIVSHKTGLSSSSCSKVKERTSPLAQSVTLQYRLAWDGGTWEAHNAPCELSAFIQSSVRKCRKQPWETTTISFSGRWLSHSRARWALSRSLPAAGAHLPCYIYAVYLALHKSSRLDVENIPWCASQALLR